jgi:hypothetical protein
VAAPRARPRRVAGIDRHDEDARQAGLVLDERPELVERPSRVPGAVLPPNRCPLPDPAEVFDDDPASGAVGTGDDGLADLVVDLAPEASLAAGERPQSFLGPLGPFALVSRR